MPLSVTLRGRRARGTVLLTVEAARGVFVAVSPGVYRLEAGLTLLTVSALRDAGLKLIADATDALTLDLGSVPEVDSAGLALLIDWLANARSRDCKLHYAKPGKTLLSLARLSEVEPLLTELEPRSPGVDPHPGPHQPKSA